MSRSWWAVALLLIAVGLNCLGADEPTLDPGDGVLVLRNGFVLQGRITPVNEMYLVSIGASGEVRLPRAEVEFQCRSLDEAYLRKRDALQTDEPAAHLGLADWCLRHGLLCRAADQLLTVYVQEPTHPRLAALEQRLHSLSAPSTSVATVAKLQVAAIPQEATRVSKLSPQLMQQFTTVVQPILLNRCATYACHGNGGTANYRLIRPSSGHATTSRMTHRNLQATLLFMDHEHPEKSSILEHGSLPHGGAQAPAFTEKQSQQLDLLTAWVRRAAVRPVESITTNRGGPKRLVNRPPTKLASDAPQAAPGTKTTVERASAVIPAGHAELIPAPGPVVPRPLADDPMGRDPFDPEVFNQRYHRATKPSVHDEPRPFSAPQPKR